MLADLVDLKRTSGEMNARKSEQEKNRKKRTTKRKTRRGKPARRFSGIPRDPGVYQLEEQQPSHLPGGRGQRP